MSDKRLIKKYPNRRLYDTAISSYVTIADVKQMIIEYEDIEIVDAKTGEDLTRSVFLQILSEEEAGGTPIFKQRNHLPNDSYVWQGIAKFVCSFFGTKYENFCRLAKSN